jgi:hypothetical protein
MPETARDSETGAFVKASDASKKSKYVCLCPDKHAVFLRKGTERVAHFAHYSPEGGGEITCRGGGESEEHMEAKHRLKMMQGRFKFALKKCTECGESLWEDCQGELELEVRSLDKRWRYDVLLTRPDKTQLALEVYHTHASGKDKVESSALIGVPIAEFRAQDIRYLGGGGVLHNLQCDGKWLCGDKCADRKRRREDAARKAEADARMALEAVRKAQEAARVAREKRLREEQEAARVARESRARVQDEADRVYIEGKRHVLEDERDLEQGGKRRKKGEKLYYHCKFNGCNNTLYWAPLGEGVRTYGEVYACGGGMME